MSDDINSALWHGLIITCADVNAKYEKLLKGIGKEYGLNICEVKMLVCLFYSHKPHTLRYITEATHYFKGMISKCAERLEKDGYITMIPDEFDKRAVRVSLCEKSTDFLNEAAGKRLSFSNNVFKGLNDVELKQMGHLTSVIHNNTEKL